MENLLKSLTTASDLIHKIQKGILGIVVFVLIVVNALQVIGRYFLGFSLPWSEQLSVVLFVVLVMLGGSFAIRTDSEIKIAILKSKNQLLTNYIVDFISLVVICILVVSSSLLIKQSTELKQIISSLNLDYKYVYSFLFLGFFLMAFEKTILFLRHFVRWNSHRRSL